MYQSIGSFLRDDSARSWAGDSSTSKTDFMSDVVGPSDISGDLQGASKQAIGTIQRSLKVLTAREISFNQ